MPDQNKRQIIIFMTLVIFLLIEGAAFVYVRWGPGSKEYLQSKADAILNDCSEEKYRAGCYDRKVNDLAIYGFTMEDSFAVISNIQDSDDSYQYCHVAAHSVGGKEVAKDPDRWISVVDRCLQNGQQCAYGCTHGAFLERFQKESLSSEEVEQVLPELRSLCQGSISNKKLTYTDKIGCEHAIGHVAMYITNADIERSLGICDSTASTNPSRCYEGVFMQVLHPSEPEDIALVAGQVPTRDTVREFCRKYSLDVAKEGACLRESWPYFINDIMEPKGAQKFCSSVSDEKQRVKCLDNTINIVFLRNDMREESAESFCAGFHPDNMGRCFGITAAYSIFVDEDLIDKARSICVRAMHYSVGDECLKILLEQQSLQTAPLQAPIQK